MSKPVKFHIGKKGPSKCDAKEGNCPLGGEHFGSMEDAHKEYETKNKGDLVPSMKKKGVDREKEAQREFDRLQSRPLPKSLVSPLAFPKSIDDDEVKKERTPFDYSSNVWTKGPRTEKPWDIVERELRENKNLTLGAVVQSVGLHEHEAQDLCKTVKIDDYSNEDRGTEVARYLDDRMYSEPALVIGEDALRDRLSEFEAYGFGEKVTVSAFDRDRNLVMNLEDEEDIVVVPQFRRQGDGTTDYAIYKVDPESKNNSFGYQHEMLIDPETGSVFGGAVMVVEWPEDEESQNELMENGPDYAATKGEALIEVKDLSDYKNPMIVELDTGLSVNARNVYSISYGNVPDDPVDFERIYENAAEFAYEKGFKLFGRKNKG